MERKAGYQHEDTILFEFYFGGAVCRLLLLSVCFFGRSPAAEKADFSGAEAEIGRASCRERV